MFFPIIPQKKKKKNNYCKRMEIAFFPHANLTKWLAINSLWWCIRKEESVHLYYRFLPLVWVWGMEAWQSFIRDWYSIKISLMSMLLLRTLFFKATIMGYFSDIFQNRCTINIWWMSYQRSVFIIVILLNMSGSTFKLFLKAHYNYW